MQRRRLFVAGALALGLLATSCDATSPNAATVNGVAIKDSDFQSELRGFADNEAAVAASKTGQGTPLIPGALAPPAGTGAADTAFEAAGSVTNTFSTQRLVTKIQIEMAAVELQRRKLAIDPTAPFTAEVAGFLAGDGSGSTAILDSLPAKVKASINREAAVVSSLDRELGADEAFLRESFNKSPQTFTVICASHILVATEAESKAVKTKLDGGADFATLAKEVSTEPAAKTSGGELRNQDGSCINEQTWQTSFDATFVAAVEAAKPGVPTDPFQTQFGWHVVLVTERQDTFEAVQDSMKKLYASNPTAAVAQWFQTELPKAKVSVNPRYGTWDTKNIGIQPPARPTPNVPTPTG